MKQYNLDEFEFSQAYLFYWDKIERCHYFLNNIIETAQRGETVTGRLVSFLLNVSVLVNDILRFLIGIQFAGSNLRWWTMGYDL